MLRQIGLWKYVVIVAIILGCAIYVSKQYQRATQQCEDKTAKINPGITSPPRSAEDTDKCEEDAERHFPRWYRLFSWPEGITTWAILLTLLIIADQTAHTKHAAEAALLNAKAIINAERAWVVMVIERDKEFPRLFRVKAENRGHTPAKIVAASHEWAVIKSAAEMPEEPQYRHGNRFAEGVFLFPGEFQVMSEFGRDHLRLPPIGYDQTGEQDFQRVKDNQAMCIFFGNVVYRDILSSPNEGEHETRWCSLLKLGESDELVLTRGRDGYTKYT